ncbi:MAG: DUF2442 domain-containing protein [Lachnospiraceae bacterium]|nr:DUF2442 domain-containing protein [Lachnospiraceae bacterium]
MIRPKAVKVVPLDNYKLLITFDNEEVRLYNAEPLITGEWFGRLRDPSFFKTVHVAGLSVEWAGGQDVCPDDLYYSSVPVER